MGLHPGILLWFLKIWLEAALRSVALGGGYVNGLKTEVAPMLVWKTGRRPSASILAVLISLLASQASQALSGEEHLLISRAALRLACLSAGLGIDCSDPKGKLPETDRIAL